MNPDPVMPTLCRWWLHRQWARDARVDIVARVDLALIVFGATLAVLWLAASR